MLLTRQWRKMTHGRPGHRFQDRYVAARKAREDASWGRRARRILRLIGALGAVVIGVFLMVLPGPAVLFFFIAGGLLASESRYLARFMDWSEVRLRAAWGWGRRHWDKLPVVGKIILVSLAACLGAGMAYASYRLLTR